jgi:hypothetical protein
VSGNLLRPISCRRLPGIRDSGLLKPAFGLPPTNYRHEVCRRAVTRTSIFARIPNTRFCRSSPIVRAMGKCRVRRLHPASQRALAARGRPLPSPVALLRGHECFDWRSGSTKCGIAFSSFSKRPSVKPAGNAAVPVAKHGCSRVCNTTKGTTNGNTIAARQRSHSGHKSS